jgi:hypothetical protein
MEDKQVLRDLIGRLPSRADDEVAILAIEGRALSKSDTSLHLAIPTGLIAIPLDSIMKATSVPGTKEIVRLVVRNPGAIRHLLRVVPRGGTSGQATGGGVVAQQRGELLGSGWGAGVNTCDYYNTETITGEEGNDASDDEEDDCHQDSEAPMLQLME